MTFRPPHRFAVWHDRAVLHFLTGAVDRRKYVSVVKKTLIPNGHLIIAAFAVNGPPQCSGLDVIRYDARRLCSELGDDFALLETHDEAHTTPWGTEQKFIYCRFQRGSRV